MGLAQELCYGLSCHEAFGTQHGMAVVGTRLVRLAVINQVVFVELQQGEADSQEAMRPTTIQDLLSLDNLYDQFPHNFLRDVGKPSTVVAGDTYERLNFATVQHYLDMMASSFFAHKEYTKECVTRPSALSPNDLPWEEMAQKFSVPRPLATNDGTAQLDAILSKARSRVRDALSIMKDQDNLKHKQAGRGSGGSADSGDSGGDPGSSGGAGGQGGPDAADSGDDWEKGEDSNPTGGDRGGDSGASGLGAGGGTGSATSRQVPTGFHDEFGTANVDPSLDDELPFAADASNYSHWGSSIYFRPFAELKRLLFEIDPRVMAVSVTEMNRLLLGLSVTSAKSVTTPPRASTAKSKSDATETSPSWSDRSGKTEMLKTPSDIRAPRPLPSMAPKHPERHIESADEPMTR
jgi:hypothetical protein